MVDHIQKGYYDYQFVPDVLVDRVAALRGCIPPASCLIDIGCNNGIISLALIESGHARSSIGIDFEDIRVSSPPELDFIAADLRHFDIGSLPQVDVILCLNVIHHLCRNGIDFARDFMAQLATRAGTVMCEMGSLTAQINADWLAAMKTAWQTDQQCWADLFQPFAWRRPLLTYPFQFGRRVMWKLVTDLEPPYSFEVLKEIDKPETTLRHLRRCGIDEYFWAKTYHGAKARPELIFIRQEIQKFLKNAPFESLLPLTCNQAYGDIYAYDPEIAKAMPLTPLECAQALPAEEYREVLGFAAQTIPALRDFPLDMLCDFKVIRTGRGLGFVHFEPNDYALNLISP